MKRKAACADIGRWVFFKGRFSKREKVLKKFQM